MKLLFLLHRASADYRRYIVSGLFKDVIESAWGRAG